VEYTDAFVAIVLNRKYFKKLQSEMKNHYEERFSEENREGTLGYINETMF